MELRRAILLFAIVLGLAAVATSVSRPVETGSSELSREPSPPSTSTPNATDGPETASSAAPDPDPPVTFDAGGKPRTRGIRAGDAATINVKLTEPAQVEIPALGLTGSGTPLTPAVFPIFSEKPGRYPVRVIPVGEGKARVVGHLQVTPRVEG